MIIDKDCEALLLDYAAGSLDRAHGLIIASYLTLSPEGRRFVANCEAIGGAMMEHLCEPVSLSAGCLESVLQKIDCDSAACDEIEACVASCIECCDPLPQPLSRLLPAEQPPKWKRAFGGLEWVDLKLDGCSSRAQLVRCTPGFATPHHTHPGTEITLVLDGALEDHTGRYVRGNLLVMGCDTAHNPVADRDAGCLCLTVTTHPVRFTGTLTRIISLFL